MNKREDINTSIIISLKGSATSTNGLYMFTNFKSLLSINLYFLGRGNQKVWAPGMGEIGNIGDLNLKNYCIFCSQYIDIDNYHISFLIMLPFEVRNVKIKLIQFDTKWYLFEISQNYIVKCFSSQFVLNFCTQNDVNIDSGWKSSWNWYFIYKTVINL